MAQKITRVKCVGLLGRLQPPIESGATPQNRKPTASASRGLFVDRNDAARDRRYD